MPEESLSLYTRNRVRLLGKFPRLESLLPDTPPTVESLQVVEGRRGWPTLQAHDQHGSFYLQSSYDPVKEAATYLDSEFAAEELEKGQTNFLVLLGFELGYLLEEVLRRVPTRTTVVVVLPEPEHLPLALTARDLGEVLTADNLRWVSGADPKTLAESVAASVDFSILSRWKMILTRPMMRLYPQFSREFVDAIASSLNTRKLAFNTTLVHSQHFLGNALRNLWWVYNAPGIDSLADRWLNRPAVIVAAGPSLDKQLPLLHAYQDRILIIAALQAVPTLRKAEITPHIIVVIDPKLGPADFQSEPGEGFCLVAVDIATHPESIRHGHGKLLVGHALDDNQAIFRDLHGVKGVWNAAGSVATNAFVVAVRCGANPILMIGQDLALTGGVSHGESYRHGITSVDKLRAKNPDSLRSIQGYHGDSVFTTPQYDMYRHWFENAISQLTAGRVVNCTEGGARIHGAVQRPFAEMLQECALDTAIDPEHIRAWAEPLHAITPKNLKKNIARVCSMIETIAHRAEVLNKRVKREIERTTEDGPSGVPAPIQSAVRELLNGRSSAAIIIEQMVQVEIVLVHRAMDQDDDRLNQLRSVQWLALACSKACREVMTLFEQLPTPEDA